MLSLLLFKPSLKSAILQVSLKEEIDDYQGDDHILSLDKVFFVIVR